MVGVQGPESSGYSTLPPLTQTTLSHLPLPPPRIWAQLGLALPWPPHESPLYGPPPPGGVAQGASYAPCGVRARITALKQAVSTGTMGACG